MKKFLAVATCLIFSMASNAQTINIQADKKLAAIQPTMWGLFFEDINFAADGGVYAEMVKNRSFEFAVPLMGWRIQMGQKPQGRVDVFNSGKENNPRYLQVINHSADSVIGLQNEGFRGMGVRQGATYHFSVLARKEGAGNPVLDILLLNSKDEVIGKTSVQGISGAWATHKASFTASSTDAKASLKLLVNGPATVQLDMVSLFPKDTWKGRENGLRADLVQKLADLKPGFLRFPGGCIVEGRDLANRYQWKKTVGKVEDRKVIVNRWSSEIAQRSPADYYQSYGLGFYEYFLLAEDIGAAPLPILNCGMACQFNTGELAAMDQLDPYIQDALDLVEFANGSTDTGWGKLRAEMGHPAPFNLKMIGVGNEQWGPEYVARAKVFMDAIKAKYPAIEIVGSAGPFAGGDMFTYLWQEMKVLKPDMVDEHYYAPPAFFTRNARRYDSYDTTGPKVFAGEYAAHDKPGEDGRRKNNWLAALSEAAFMTGLERNAQVVRMTSYAPLLAHVDAWQWSPNLIWFDNLRSVGSANYYVQKLFSTNKGSAVVPALQANKAVAGQDSLYASSTMDAESGDLIIKLVNANPVAKEIAFNIEGFGKPAKKATVLTLSGTDMEAENTLDNPAKFVPVETVLSVPGKQFRFGAKPGSVNVIRLKKG
ncbi:alpha-L-arabinofuranosidase [Flavisolibacter sp. BT320]|nr:alpha-L-arabinofuranosidase [Flavisolibacter longurius]